MEYGMGYGMEYSIDYSADVLLVCYERGVGWYISIWD